MTMKPENSGFSIIEVFITLSILGIVGALVTKYTVDALDNRYRIEALAMRDGLVTRLRKVVSKQNLVYSSRSFSSRGNSLLAACIEEAGRCETTDIDKPVGFFLGYPGGDGPKAMAGPRGNPVYFAHKGNRCLEAECQEWRLVSLFSAICPNNQPRCDQAQSIRVRYQIANVGLNGMALLGSIPSDEEFANTRRNNLIVRIREVFYANDCPDLSIQSGISEEGKAICVCAPGAVEIGRKNGNPVCEGRKIQCPNNKTDRLVGVDQQMNPICVPRRRYRCQVQATDRTCNGIIQGIRMGACKAGKNQTKKSSNTEIKCDENKLTCCTLR